MLQKDANRLGLAFGDAKKLAILKAVRDHVLLDKLTSEERECLNTALLMLDALGRKYKKIWDDQCRRHHEEWRRKQDEASQ